jgi:hypothetical protein
LRLRNESIISISNVKLVPNNARRYLNRHTNNSAALPVNTCFVDESAEKDILSGDDIGGCGKADESRNGFRDTGLGGGSRGDVCLGDKAGDKAGDTARLRKGLFEERLRVSPGGGWRLPTEKQGS